MRRKPNAVDTVAGAFAAALDQDDYVTAAALLARDCLYRSSKGPVNGPLAILESYRASSSWARSHIENVRYESTFRASSATSAVITFIDHLEHAGRVHRYSCEQEIFIDQEGRIRQIVHRDLDGERERLDRLLRDLRIR